MGGAIPFERRVTVSKNANGAVSRSVLVCPVAKPESAERPKNAVVRLRRESLRQKSVCMPCFANISRPVSTIKAVMPMAKTFGDGSQRTVFLGAMFHAFFVAYGF
jgi:hypothetical protein